MIKFVLSGKDVNVFLFFFVLMNVKDGMLEILLGSNIFGFNLLVVMG